MRLFQYAHLRLPPISDAKPEALISTMSLETVFSLPYLGTYMIKKLKRINGLLMFFMSFFKYTNLTYKRIFH